MQPAVSPVADVVYELATPADDAAIRRLLASNAVPGDVTLTYEREPDYFLGSSVMGPLCQTIVARDPCGDVLAVATRSARRRFVNGTPEEVGYIGQLRVDGPHRGRWLVTGGFRYLRRLHRDGRVTGYITTIIEGNREAEGVLVAHARRSLPTYREFDRLCTLALILTRLPTLTRTQWVPASGRGFELRTGDSLDLDDLVAFLNRAGATRQFCPVYGREDFTGATRQFRSVNGRGDFAGATLRDFRLADMLVACRRGRIVGTLGLWDQSGYKQTVVAAYSPTLRRVKPFYNLAARLVGARPLTPIGAAIPTVYAAFVNIEDDDKAIFAVLLAQAMRRAADRRAAYLTFGLSTRDPLLTVARRCPHVPYYSRAYTVCWPGDEEFHTRLDGRIPYLEIATL